MTPTLQILFAAFAVYRVAHMVATEDGPGEMFLRFRNRYTDDGDWFARGIRCPLCVGFWVAAFAGLYLVMLGVISLDVWPLAWPGLAGMAALIDKWWKQR